MKTIQLSSDSRLLFLVDSAGFGNGNTLRKKYKIFEITPSQTFEITEQVAGVAKYRLTGPANSKTFTTTDNPEDVLYMLGLNGEIETGETLKYEAIGVGRGGYLYGSGVKEYTQKARTKTV